MTDLSVQSNSETVLVVLEYTLVFCSTYQRGEFERGCVKDVMFSSWLF